MPNININFNKITLESYDVVSKYLDDGTFFIVLARCMFYETNGDCMCNLQTHIHSVANILDTINK